MSELYRGGNKGLYVVAWNFFLLLLDCSAWPCLGPAYQNKQTFISPSVCFYIRGSEVPIAGRNLEMGFTQPLGEEYALLSAPSVTNKHSSDAFLSWRITMTHLCEKSPSLLRLPSFLSRSDDTFCPLLIVAQRVSSAWEQVIRVWKETDHPSLSTLDFEISVIGLG